MKTVESPVLEVRNLHIGTAGGISLVRNIDFEVGRGEIVGIVGESGSGKSLLTLAVSQLLPRNVVARADVLKFLGTPLEPNAPSDLTGSLLGTDLAMVFQDPMASLNPARKIGSQMVEAIRFHKKIPKRLAFSKAEAALSQVQIQDSSRVMKQYPHELSGGMRQRVMIAMAILLEPQLIIADEPTTALDVRVQAQVMSLLRELNRELKSAILLISHDIALLSEVCDRILVMQQGELIETFVISDLFARSHEPYTEALIGAIPTFDSDPEKPLGVLDDED